MCGSPAINQENLSVDICAVAQESEIDRLRKGQSLRLASGAFRSASQVRLKVSVERFANSILVVLC